jgi:hypothetical protein
MRWFVVAIVSLGAIASVVADAPAPPIAQPAQTSRCTCPAQTYSSQALCFCDKAKRLRFVINAASVNVYRGGTVETADAPATAKLCGCPASDPKGVCLCSGKSKYITFSDVGDGDRPPSCLVFDYDKAGKRSVERSYDGLELRDTRTYTRDAAGHVVREELRGSDGTLRLASAMKYDGDRLVIHESDQDGDGKPERTTVKRYDANGYRLGEDRWWRVRGEDETTRCTYTKPCPPDQDAEGCAGITYSNWNCGSIPAGVKRPASIMTK